MLTRFISRAAEHISLKQSISNALGSTFHRKQNQQELCSMISKLLIVFIENFEIFEEIGDETIGLK